MSNSNTPGMAGPPRLIGGNCPACGWAYTEVAAKIQKCLRCQLPMGETLEPEVPDAG